MAETAVRDNIGQNGLRASDNEVPRYQSYCLEALRGIAVDLYCSFCPAFHEHFRQRKAGGGQALLCCAYRSLFLSAV